MIYKQFKYGDMEEKGLIMCATCNNKSFISVDNDGTRKYYCSIVDGIVRNGIVYDTTDASDCINEGVYIQDV